MLDLGQNTICRCVVWHLVLVLVELGVEYFLVIDICVGFGPEHYLQLRSMASGVGVG